MRVTLFILNPLCKCETVFVRSPNAGRFSSLYLNRLEYVFSRTGVVIYYNTRRREIRHIHIIIMKSLLYHFCNTHIIVYRVIKVSCYKSRENFIRFRCCLHLFTNFDHTVSIYIYIYKPKRHFPYKLVYFLKLVKTFDVPMLFSRNNL